MYAQMHQKIMDALAKIGPLTCSLSGQHGHLHGDHIVGE